MKASQFIKVALMDQMQQIANLELWFHVAKLLPAGIETLARVRYSGYPNIENGSVFLPLKIEDVVTRFYDEFAPEYSGKYPISHSFFSGRVTCFLTSSPEDAEKHLTLTKNEKPIVYVPKWLDDFKQWCNAVLGMIEREEIEDIEVFKSDAQ